MFAVRSISELTNPIDLYGSGFLSRGGKNHHGQADPGLLDHF
jgi:hypothetical protein